MAVRYTSHVPFDLTMSQILALAALGLVAGALGGMLGIGGSIIMIPVLTLMFGSQHLSQASAMIINVFIAVPAMLQHYRARAVRWDVMAKMLPFGIVFIIAGVEASNLMEGDLLEKVFGVFLLYVIATNVIHLVSRAPEPRVEHQRANWLTIGLTGSLTGFMAGLLGIGGGIVAVPLLQRLAKLPLRQCIGTTAAFMCVSSAFGAIRKNMTLADVTSTASVEQSIAIAAWLAVPAVAGALVGGKLTHVLPLSWVRLALILLLAWASANMLGLV